MKKNVLPTNRYYVCWGEDVRENKLLIFCQSVRAPYWHLLTNIAKCTYTCVDLCVIVWILPNMCYGPFVNRDHTCCVKATSCLISKQIARLCSLFKSLSTKHIPNKDPFFIFRNSHYRCVLGVSVVERLLSLTTNHQLHNTVRIPDKCNEWRSCAASQRKAWGLPPSLKLVKSSKGHSYWCDAEAQKKNNTDMFGSLCLTLSLNILYYDISSYLAKSIYRRNVINEQAIIVMLHKTRHRHFFQQVPYFVVVTYDNNPHQPYTAISLLHFNLWQ